MNFQSKGQGIPFLFQHGLGSNLAQPQNLLDQVRGVQLISADCPGHGATPLPSKIIPSFDYYADEIIQLMDKLNSKKAILGGISMGAGIALNIAVRFPEKVEALVLVRPAWLANPNPKNLRILCRAADWIGQVEGATSFQFDIEYMDIEKKLPLAAKSIMGVFASSQRKELPLVLNSLVGSQPIQQLSDLKKLTMPCLIIGNVDDPLHPFEMALNLQEVIPNSQLKKIVSRYIDNEQHKRMVNELVNDFIKSHC